MTPGSRGSTTLRRWVDSYLAERGGLGSTRPGEVRCPSRVAGLFAYGIVPIPHMGRWATPSPQESARSRVRGVEHAADWKQDACRDAPRSSAKTHVMKSARCTTTYADPWSGAPLASILHEHPGRGTLASSRRCESV